MKTLFKIVAGILLTMTFIYEGNAAPAEEYPDESGLLQLVCPEDLSGLVNLWTAEYLKSRPELKIDIRHTSPAGQTGELNSGLHIGFIGDISPSDHNTLIVVGRDVIVPVMNSTNPFIEEIQRHGISIEALAKIFDEPGNRQWGILLDNNISAPVNFYLTDDASINAGMAGLLGIELVEMEGMNKTKTADLIVAVQKDPLAIGFCRLIDIVSTSNDEFAPNISLLPFDRNANGKLDSFEKIYASPSAFSRGVWIGKYPKNLVRELYCLIDAAAVDQKEIAFMQWVINEGQANLDAYGLTDLTIGEKHSALAKLPINKIIPPVTPEKFPMVKFIIMLIIGAIVLGFVVEYLVLYIRRIRKIKGKALSGQLSVFDESSVDVPAGVYFDKTHTWAFMEKNGLVRIGLDDFLSHVTGRLSAIRTKLPGEKVKKGEVIITLVQKGKQLNIKSPISGVIRQNNEILNENPAMVNLSPYQDGWVYLIEPTNWLREIQLMFMADRFQRRLNCDFMRLKDFLANFTNRTENRYADIVLQDGGKIAEGVLENLGPEAWEDFQINFIDPSVL